MASTNTTKHIDENTPLMFLAGPMLIGTATDEFLRGLIVMQRWRKKKWRRKNERTVQTD